MHRQRGWRAQVTGAAAACPGAQTHPDAGPARPGPNAGTAARAGRAPNLARPAGWVWAREMPAAPVTAPHTSEVEENSAQLWCRSWAASTPHALRCPAGGPHPKAEAKREGGKGATAQARAENARCQPPGCAPGCSAATSHAGAGSAVRAAAQPGPAAERARRATATDQAARAAPGTCTLCGKSLRAGKTARRQSQPSRDDFP